MSSSPLRARPLFPAQAEIPKEFDLPSPIEQREYLIDGEIRRWDGPMKDAISPICIRRPEGVVQKRIGSFPLLSEEEAMRALDAAVRAYDNGRGEWPSMRVEDRLRHMQEFVLRMKEKRSEIVKLLMWEIAKSLKDSEKEFDRTVTYIQDTIDAYKDLDRVCSRFVINEQIIGQIRRAPLGVVLCMGPFNYPLNETFTTLIPALVMGNSVVFKPPRLGVLLHRSLLEAFRDSFPRGVVNTVYGRGTQVAGPLMATGRIDVLAFIGSSKAADVLKKQHPRPHRLRCVLGLNAKNPAIILPDADLDLAAKECLLGSLSFNGQRCTALKILFVHRRVADDFLGRLSDAVGKLKRGMPWDENVAITPLAGPDRAGLMAEYVQDSLQNGARLVNPGGGVADQTFFSPAILYSVTPQMRLYREEQFGPVIPVLPFDDVETPIRYVVESDYGQQLSVFGKDPDVVAKLIDPLVNQVCRVNINSQCQRGPDVFPFTGRKDSAEGTLSVSDALRVFSIRTLVAAKENDSNAEIINRIVRERKSQFLSTDFIL